MKGEINETYLNNILRLEIKNVNTIQKVSQQFYKEVRDYLESLKGKIEVETVKKNPRQIGRISTELENSEKYFRKVIDLRISKILRAKAKNDREEVEGKMTPEEQVFFENIAKGVKDFGEQLENGEAIMPSSQRMEENQREDEGEEKEEDEYVSVYVLNEIKGISILGKPVDLRKEDIVTLPAKYAEIVIKQGYGKKLNGETTIR